MTLTRTNTMVYIVAAALLMCALLFAQVSFAQTGTTSTTTTGGTGTTDSSVGFPNTGAGGDAALNLAILSASGLIALGGAVILARRFAR